MKKRISKPTSKKNEKGNYLAFFAFILPSVLAIMALLLDIGGLAVTHTRAQLAADAAVFAGAQGLDMEKFYKEQILELDRQVSAANAGQFLSANSRGGRVQMASFYMDEEQIWVIADAQYKSMFGGIFGANIMVARAYSSSVFEWGIDDIEQ